MSHVHLPGRKAPEAVYRVTDARRPHSDDQHSRVVKYLVSMSVRMVCLALALFVPSPWFWLCVIGAVTLPYVAVVIANAGVEQRPAPFERAVQEPLQLGGGSGDVDDRREPR
ncbi:MAG: DUF3099 domain-containing protein [Actinomycetes bacterium]